MRSWLYRKPERYDRMLEWLHGDNVGRRFEHIARLIGPGRRVLDLGAGTCTLADYLEAGCEYVGAELNPDFRAHAAERGLESIDLNVFAFDQYPLDVDAVVAADLLHHLVPDVTKFFAGLARLDVGKVIVCESYPYGARLLTRVFGPIIDNDGFNNLPARLRHHLFDEFTEERLRREMGEVFTGWNAHFEVLTERDEPGRGKRGWDTLIACFERLDRGEDGS